MVHCGQLARSSTSNQPLTSTTEIRWSTLAMRSSTWSDTGGITSTSMLSIISEPNPVRGNCWRNRLDSRLRFQHEAHEDHVRIRMLIFKLPQFVLFVILGVNSASS